MSKTLFWYIFRELFRVFLMASTTLAGIMSFGGLLKPLTDNGLDASQVGKMLSYLTPAMMTYAMPIAALFATTTVYGRLSSDNELTACRAGGISFLSLSVPAIVLGLAVALASLLFLCFVVPLFNLKAEQVIYSNLSRLVQNQIERTHTVTMGPYSVYAQSARLMPNDPGVVELIGPMIATYEALDPKAKGILRVPIASEFFLAKRATANIVQSNDDVSLTVVLENGTHFRRNTSVARQVDEISVSKQRFGPYPMASPIRENPKFMAIDELKELYDNPDQSISLQADLSQQIMRDQSNLMLQKIRNSLSETGSYKMVSGDDIFTLTKGDLEADYQEKITTLILRSKQQPESRQIKLVRSNRRGGVPFVLEAVEMRVRVNPKWTYKDKAPGTVDVTFEGFDVVSQKSALDLNMQASDSGPIKAGNSNLALSDAKPGNDPTGTGVDDAIRLEEERARHSKFGPKIVSIDLPPDIESLRYNTVEYYLKSPDKKNSNLNRMIESRKVLLWRLLGEIHMRSSFAISCLVLAVMGCALGLLFKTSNFLSSFAVSFIPAMLTIALIVTGQQICSHAKNSPTLGLAFIWVGNAMVLSLATILLGKLQRT